VLPKRQHAIYKGALAQKPVVLPRDTSRATPVQRQRAAAQQKTEAAVQDSLKRLCKFLGVNEIKRLKQDTYLRQKFDILDQSGDGRVDADELKVALRSDHPEMSARDAWLLLNVGDTNNDKVITFDEFKCVLPRAR
jgi:Ca2+-binding EF-hand superfamily protein